MHSRFAKKAILIVLLLQCLDNLYIRDSVIMDYERSEGILATLSMYTSTILLIIGMIGILVIVIKLFFFSYNDKTRKYFILFYSLSIIGMVLTELQRTFISDDLINTMQLSRGVVVVTISLFIWMLITMGIFLWIYSTEKIMINVHLIFKILKYIISIVMIIVVFYLVVCLISGQSIKYLINLDSFDSFDIDRFWDSNYSAVRNIITLFFFSFMAV